MTEAAKAFNESRALQREIEAAKVLREQIAALSEGDEDFIRDTIEGETNIRELIGALVANEAEDDAIVEGIVKLISSLQARKKRVEARIGFRRSLIANGLDIAGLPRLETPGGTVSVKIVPPKLIINDESAIPAKYWTAGEPTLERKELLADLKVRNLPDGADLPPIPGAALSNGGQTIAIRR